MYATDAPTIGGQGAHSSMRSFIVGVRQPSITSNLSARGIDGQEFFQSTGNYTTAFTDVSVKTAGPPLSVRSYNTMDPWRDSAFGAGWSTRFDMRIVPETIRGFEALLVIYPDGYTVRFADKKDGTFQSPPGMYATVAKVVEGGWRLMDKPATSPIVSADSSYDGAGIGLCIPVRQPADGRPLDIDTRTRNMLLRALRCRGERGFALLTQGWRTLQGIAVGPSKIGDIARAALVLTRFEQGRLI
ncbi:DUF6531 domain-containing protein [Streptosporangium sp. CA-135522]|uniref:DUF6531 domain-containing protein n=1 Tax=Streptosporangium sp. CA-135522 TaxID=3240072 RepID=UPI003D8E4708